MKDKRVINEMVVRFKDYFNFKKAGSRELIRRALLIACVVIFVVCGYDVVEKWYNDYKTSEKYKNIEKPVDNNKDNDNMFDNSEENIDNFNLINMETFSGITSVYSMKTPQIEKGDSLTSSGNVIGEGYLDLLKRNEDVVGYVEIKDTNIQYNIVQNKVDNEYYLKKDIDKQYAYAGTIYMDYRNRIYAEDKNTVLYGHNMNNKTMFQNLHNYKSAEFAKEHLYITYDTIYESMTWEVFAVYKNNISNDFTYTQVSFGNDEEYAKYLSKCKSASAHKFSADPGIYDRILTLSTCDSRDEVRYVVQAMLVSRTKR